jgi:hypothetical protein
MKRVSCIFTLMIVLFIFPLFVSADNSWYEGGALHRATVSQWNKASYSNKLATAADWAMVRPKIKDKVEQTGDMETLKPFAVELIQCVDEAAAGKGYDNMKVSELAASCMILMGW